MSMITGTEAAKRAGVHPATWGRWVALGKAPAPAFTNSSNISLFDEVEVGEFLEGEDQ